MELEIDPLRGREKLMKKSNLKFVLRTLQKVERKMRRIKIHLITFTSLLTRAKVHSLSAQNHFRELFV